MSGIAFIESWWSSLVTNVAEHHLKGVVTFVVHETFFWSSYIPFFIADFIPALQRYKIQGSVSNRKDDQVRCFLRVMVNHLLLVLPMIIVTHPIFDVMGCTHSTSSLPSIPVMLIQIGFFFLIEDYVFFWGHRALHTPWLYKKIHSVHHEHSAPFGIAAEFAHPVEVVFLGMATLAGPILIGPHLLTIYIYLGLRCMQTIECHSGYDFPWSPRKWLPGYGGAEFHDHHHRIHSGNYSSSFRWVDAVHGTDESYRDWKKKQMKTC